MGQVSSAFDPDHGKVAAPENYVVPPFPSLYNPTLSSTTDQLGYFLYDADAIWRFTIYWTLILASGMFLICGILASFNLLLSLTVFRPKHRSSPESGKRGAGAGSRHDVQIKSRKRPSLWLILLIPFTMLGFAGFVGIVSGTVVGFALAAIYSSGGFSMSTWVPFLWALIQVVVLLISSYSSLTSVL